MAQPWKPIVEQLRNPAPPFDLPPQKTPTPSAWTRDQLRVANRAAAAPVSAPAAPVTPAAAPPATAAPAAAEAAGAKSTGWFKRTANALRNPVQAMSSAMPTAEGAGRFAGSAVRTALPAAVGLHTVNHLNDFKINDPTNDSSVGGTFSALRKGDFSGAGRSLSKGALEAGMDLGSAAANIADVFVPGKAPVSTAYNNMLREKFGDQLVDRTGTAPAANPAAPAATNQASYSNEHLRAPVTPQPPANVVTRTGNSFSGSDIKPGFTYADGSQGKGTVTSLDTSEGHRQNMLELQRNASERAAAPAPSVAGGFGGGGSTTMSQDLRAKTDAGQTPRGLSPYDTAQLQQQQAQTQQQGELGRAQIAATQTGNNNALRVAEMNNATQRENNAATTRTAMRGHELDFQGRMAPIEVARQQRLRAATYMQGGGAAEGGAGGAGGRYAAAAQAAAANGDDALAQHFATLATGEQSRGAAVDTQQASRAAGTEKLFKPFFTKDVTGKDGTVSQQFDEVGAAKAAATVRGMYGEKFDKLSDDQKRGAILEVVAQQRNADAEAQVMPGFVDRALDVVGLYDKPAPIQGGRRDIRGGKPEKAGLISPPGVSRHDTLLRLPNGQTVNYGVVTDQQIADINERSRLR